MFLLYNGEFQEIDMQMDHNDQQILDACEKRRRFVGQQIGDFEIISAEYDWGLRRQVNIAKCIRCGKEKEIPNLRDFARGKGVGRACPCRYKKERSIPAGEIYRTYIGKVVGSFRLLSYEARKGFRTECIECGKQKWVSGKRILNQEEKCNHKIVRDYSDPSYLDKRIGNLTVVEKVGNMFRFRCDCGTEIVQRPTDVFRMDNVKTCGRVDCPCHRAAVKAGEIKRQQGVEFEKECAAMMQKQGFTVEMTPETGDYGVDFFATVNGERVAFQCKRLKSASLVGAVQEVYAGGRYYDCCKFVVVAPSGFTYSAELMASKLGVQLEIDLQNFKLKTLEENKIDTQKIKAFSRNALIWEIDGVAKPAYQWCAEYGVSRNAVTDRMERGLDLKSALTMSQYRKNQNLIEIDGVLKTRQQWCDQYGISPQLYNYRVKYSKLSPIEALTKEKKEAKRITGTPKSADI